jgi:hypothetical protein
MPTQLTTETATITTAAIEVKTQPPRFPQLHDPEWLREQYEVQGRSQPEIAAEVGCSLATVQKLLRRHGIASRRAGRPTVHGQTSTPTWRSWRSMQNRCTNPKHEKWSLYGGRGITVCARWTEPDGQGFVNFLADMGERPEGMTLDRIDPDGHYEPANCRWADARTQRANRRDSTPADLPQLFIAV